MTIEQQASGVRGNAFRGVAAPIARIESDVVVGLGVGVVLLSIERLVLGLITEGCGPPS